MVGAGKQMQRVHQNRGKTSNQLKCILILLVSAFNTSFSEEYFFWLDKGGTAKTLVFQDILTKHHIFIGKVHKTWFIPRIICLWFFIDTCIYI